MSAQQPVSHIMRNSLIFGAILGVLGVGNTLIQWITGAYHLVGTSANGFSSVSLNDSGASSLLGCLVFFAMLVLTFVAGMLAARGSGRVRSGALSGLLTGIVGGLISGIGGIVVMAVVVAPGLEVPSDVSMTPTQVETLVIGVVVAVSILVFLVETGFGAGMGALGGLIGANSYRKAVVSVPASFTPGFPDHPHYPGMLAQPGSSPQALNYPNPPQYPQQQGSRPLSQQ
jgi:hypothetical protein